LRTPSLSCTCALSFLLSSGASAAVHEVVVQDNLYVPANLTIQVGDTVRWIDDARAAHLHNAVADDNSWQSGAPSYTWQYERQFDQPGEFFYHCSQHSSPGQSILLEHNGRIVVEQDGPVFQINEFISDAWYDPATDGQGFFIIVWEASQYVFLSWFTYDTQRPPPEVSSVLGDPGHRWLTAQGGYQGDTASLDVYFSSGGVFDSAEPPVGSAVQDGTMEITWTGCNAGVVAYDIPSLGLQGEVPVQRIVLDNVPACMQAQPTQ
jgi:plastocyanin